VDCRAGKSKYRLLTLGVISIVGLAIWGFFARRGNESTSVPQVAWKHTSRGFLGVLHIDKDHVFCIAGGASANETTSILTCLSRKTGAVRWSLQHTNWEQGHSFGLDSFYVGVVEATRNLFVRRATSDGSKRWEIEAPGEVVCSAVDGKLVWFVTRDGKVFGLDADSGKVRWTNNLSPSNAPRNFGTLGGLAYRDGMLIIDAHLSNDYTRAADKRKLVVDAMNGELLAELGPWPCWLAGSSIFGFGTVSNYLQRWDLKQRQTKADTPLLPDAAIVTISEAEIPGKLVVVYQDWTNKTPRMQIFDASGNRLAGPLPEYCYELLTVNGRYAIFQDRAPETLPRLVSAFDIATGKQLWATNCGNFASWAYGATASHFAYVNNNGSVAIRSMTNGIWLGQVQVRRSDGIYSVTCAGEDVIVCSGDQIVMIRLSYP